MKKITTFLAAFLLLACSCTAVAQRQQTLFPPGTALYPGLTVNSDRKSGLFQKDASTLAFSVNGVESFTFSKNGILSGIPAGGVSPPAGNSFMVHLDPDQVPESAGSVWGISNGLKFEGTTADDFEITLSVIGSPAADTIYAMKDSANALEYLLASASATDVPFVITDLATNAPHVADSIWGETQQIYWEGSVVDDNETRLGAIEATKITRAWIGDYNKNSIGGNVWIAVSTGSAAAVIPGSASAVWLGGSQIEFEGSSEDSIELRLKIREPTGTDKEIFLPNIAGDLLVSQASTKEVLMGSSTFAGLPSATNGSIVYCSNCDPASTPCTTGGASTGNFAFREAAAWNCK